MLKNVDQNQTFRKYWPKLRFFENFDQKKFSKNLDQNRHFRKFWPKSTFSKKFDWYGDCFEKIDQNQNFSIII